MSTTTFVEDHGIDGGVKPLRGGLVANDDALAAKREANIAAKEAERQRKEAERAAPGRRRSVAAPSAAAPSSRKQSAVGAKQELDEKRRDEVQQKATRRRNSIATTEQVRAQKQSTIDAAADLRPASKYSRREVMILFELFSEYDVDGGGFISVAELRAHFLKLAASKTNYDGRTKSFADRRAARAHIDMAALVEPMFEAIDVDNDGTVTFFELLRVIYPRANEEDFATFKEWVYPPKPYVAPIEYVLSADQKAELKEMFRVIDIDRSGELTVIELKKMFRGSAVTGETGIEMEDLQKFFDEADFDNSSSICLPEFEKLMVSTGLYVPETVATPAGDS